MADTKEKSYVEDIDRSVYDIRDEEHDAYRMQEGLTPAIVDQLSKEKNDPVWMQQFRLQSLQIYNEMPLPDWALLLKDSISTTSRPMFVRTRRCRMTGRMFRRILRTRSIVLASRKRSASPWPVSERSMTPSWSIIMFATR